MFWKWKVEMEKRKSQALCLHEYALVSESQDCDMYRSWEVYHMYCPICDSEIAVKSDEGKNILKKQEIRESYQRSMTNW